MQVQLRIVSECCGAPPIDEVDEYLTGRCSDCKENALFYVQKGDDA